MRPSLVDLDIIIPVYNEGANIISVLDALQRDVNCTHRILICYDFDEDNTLDAIAGYSPNQGNIILVKNPSSGPHSAIMAGINSSTAPFVLTHMADDDYTTPVIDGMVAKGKEGYEVVTGSRFMKGGEFVGGSWLKRLLTWGASFSLYHFARFPVHDATHGVRIFSRRILENFEVESSLGFTYSFEMMVKVVRFGWPVHEVPVSWYERTIGASRFRVWRWLWSYLRWYFFAFATTWLRKGPKSVPLKPDSKLLDS
jgi:dolichol-phosphate mannosyltransferase